MSFWTAHLLVRCTVPLNRDHASFCVSVRPMCGVRSERRLWTESGAFQSVRRASRLEQRYRDFRNFYTKRRVRLGVLAAFADEGLLSRYLRSAHRRLGLCHSCQPDFMYATRIGNDTHVDSKKSCLELPRWMYVVDQKLVAWSSGRDAHSHIEVLLRCNA